MEIKTKYNPGQEVWAMMNNKPQRLIIDSIDITILLNFDKKPTYAMDYHCSLGSFGGKFKEESLCSTKEELKNKVFK